MDATEKALLAVEEGYCRLCGEWSAKLCKSHILPDLAYEGVIDTQSHPRMVVVRDVKEGLISDKRHQTGFRERLLCRKCEDQFSAYETYASNHLLSLDLPLPRSDDEILNTVHVGDYTRLKLFLLSLLWRVGIAQHGFFGGVEPGPLTPTSCARCLNAKIPASQTNMVARSRVSYRSGTFQ